MKFALLYSIVDPDPHGSETFAWIQQRMKEQILSLNLGL